MYDALGIHWASSIPAFLALACLPFPFVFYRYGPAIRKRCKFASEAEAFLIRLRDEAQNGDDGTTSADEKGSTADKSENGQLSELNSSGRQREDDREAQLEAEAMDYSYGAEERQPQFAAIKSPNETRSSNGLAGKKSNISLQRSRSRTYEASPYDIDRVNTNDSFGRRPPNSRASSYRR